MNVIVGSLVLQTKIKSFGGRNINFGVSEKRNKTISKKFDIRCSINVKKIKTNKKAEIKKHLTLNTS